MRQAIRLSDYKQQSRCRSVCMVNHRFNSKVKYAFIAKTPLQSRVRPNTHLVVMCTMHITLPIPEFTRNERDFHCDVLHIMTVVVTFCIRLFSNSISHRQDYQTTTTCAKIQSDRAHANG